MTRFIHLVAVSMSVEHVRFRCLLSLCFFKIENDTIHLLLLAIALLHDKFFHILFMFLCRITCNQINQLTNVGISDVFIVAVVDAILSCNFT